MATHIHQYFVNRLTTPIKRNRVREWIKKQETHFRLKDTCRLKVTGWRNIYHASRYQKRAMAATLTLDKIGFKTKTVTRDKEGHYITLKTTIQQEDITIINFYAPNVGATKYITLLITNKGNNP